MKQSFIEQVESHDLAMVRLSLSMELMLDPRGVSFCEMLSYADNKLPDLFEEHDGKTYSENESDWNQELFFSVKNDLDRNFSKERLELYEKMSRVVLKEKIDALNKEGIDRNVYQERQSQSAGRDSYDNIDSKESIMIKQSFIEQVESHDLAMARLSLSMELMLDPRGLSFCEMLSYADNKLPDLFEEHDGKTYSEDEADWNKELFFSVKNDLDRNFSKERLELYEKMSRVVLKEKIDALNKEDRDRKIKQERQSQNTGRDSYNNIDSEESIPWKWIALVGAGIAALIAIILGRNNIN